MALSTDQLPMNCSLCKKSAAMRAEWGCETPNLESPWTIECVVCNGNPGNENCQECKGRGEVMLSTCPRLTVTPAHFDLIGYHSWMKDGLLPEQGSILDQTKVFLEAVSFVGNEISDYEQRRLDAK